MTCTPQLATLSRRSANSVRGAGQLARWLLVLAVVFDLLSAPFHHHHHDGVEGLLQIATTHTSLDDSEPHVESANHPLVSHATMAIRIDPSRLGQLPAIDDPEAQVALVSVAQRLAAVEELPPKDWRPDRSRADFRSHRSLPPAGRAPPLHA